MLDKIYVLRLLLNLIQRWLNRIEESTFLVLNLVQRCWILIDRDWDIILLYLYCEGNLAADFLTKLACSHAYELVTYETPMLKILQILHNDLLNCHMLKELKTSPLKDLLFCVMLRTFALLLIKKKRK